MTVIVCDICKNPIPAATRTYSWQTRYDRYETIKDKDMCPDCLGHLETSVNEELGQVDKFQFLEYKNTLAEKLSEMGMWDTKEKNRLIEAK